jgi:hypothetical protein
LTRSRDVATQGGLVLIGSATIGSAVSTITINNCFSSVYDNYKLSISGSIPSTGADMRLTPTAVTGTPAVYGSSVYSRSYDGTIARYGDAGSTYFTVGLVSALAYLDCEIQAPYVSSKMTVVYSRFVNSNGGPGGANGMYNGFENSALTCTGLVMSLSSGTFTGGTISVYGYKK